jgi:hypothetical protein
MGFILSVVLFYSPKGLQLNLRETLVPLGFYVVGTLYLVVVSVWLQKMNMVTAVIFFALYPV